jgi:hypothetical protein
MALPAYVGQASAQDHTGTSRTSLSTTPAFNLAAGNMVVVVVRVGTVVSSVTDLAGNVYAQDGVDSQQAFWSCKNALPHAANIVTANFGLNAYVNISALQFSGCHPTTHFDVHATGSSSVTSVSCTPVGTRYDQIAVVSSGLGAGGNPTFSPAMNVVYNGGSHSVAYGINQSKYWDGTKTITATFAGAQPKTISIGIYNAANLGTIDDRVSQINAELVRGGLGDLRVSQLNVELVRPNTYPPAGARITQHIVELISLPAAPARVTQMAVEVLSLPPAPARLTQMAVEVLTIPSPPSSITQMAIELLMPSPPSGENTSLWID